MALKESQAVVRDRARRMKWWREARYGMFIHYGLYSQLGRGEWVMCWDCIPRPKYEKLARTFNPRPDAVRRWAALAKKSGMKYVVLTTKHHDGFCLWDSKVTDYNSVNSKAGRDLVAEYVKACRQAGLKVGFYYSLLDWHHPDCARAANNEPARKRFVRYTYDLVQELMTHYGKVDVLWYDGPCPLTTAEQWQSRKLNAMVRELQPDIIINNRSRLDEDFGTPEQSIIAAQAGRAWEACMTFTGAWGWYPAPAEDWMSVRELLQRLRQVANGKGNLLQNIGPKADGSVPKIAEDCLIKGGKWLRENGEAVYGATDPVKKLPKWLMNGRWTLKGKAAYFWCPVWLGTELVIGGLNAKVKKVTMLGTGKAVRFKQAKERLILSGLPAKCPDRVTQLAIFKIELATRPRQERTTGYRVI